MFKKKPIVLAASLIAAVAAVQAQTAPAAPAPEPSPFTANIALTTNYKFRGQDQGSTKYVSPAVQGGFDFTLNGFYIGNWNSNVDFADSIEMDFYGGYRGEVMEGLAYDVGILQYYYPQKGKETNFDVTEIYGAVTYQFLTFKYSHTVSKDYFGLGELAILNGVNGRNTGYLELNANYPLVDKVTLNAHVGYTRLSKDLHKDDGYPRFFDYKAGVTYDLGSGFAIAGAVVGANKKGFYGDYNKTRAVLTLSKAM